MTILSKEHPPLFSFSSLPVSKGKINGKFGNTDIQEILLLLLVEDTYLE